MEEAVVDARGNGGGVELRNCGVVGAPKGEGPSEPAASVVVGGGCCADDRVVVMPVFPAASEAIGFDGAAVGREVLSLLQASVVCDGEDVGLRHVGEECFDAEAGVAGRGCCIVVVQAGEDADEEPVDDGD